MDKADAQKVIREADLAYDKGECRKALELYKRALVLDPKSARAWHGAGLSLWGTGDVDDALKALNESLKLEPSNAVTVLDKAALLTDERREHRAALRLCDKILLKPLHVCDAADARFIAARAHFGIGNDSLAMEMLDQALELRQRDLEMILWKAHAQFERAEFEAARETIEWALQLEPDEAQSHYEHGLVLEFLGENKTAEAEFQRAHDLSPAACPLPVALSGAELERLAAQTMQSLRPEFREAVRDVAVILEDLPSRDLLRSEPSLSPQILGLFTGNCHQYRHTGGPEPTAIILYRKNLEKAARNEKELRKEIRVTLLHEIAHYLGFDEEDMEELGLE